GGTLALEQERELQAAHGLALHHDAVRAFDDVRLEAAVLEGFLQRHGHDLRRAIDDADDPDAAGPRDAQVKGLTTGRDHERDAEGAGRQACPFHGDLLCSGPRVRNLRAEAYSERATVAE